MIMMSFICSCRNKIGAELHIYLEEGTYHKRLFRGPSTNDMKEWDGPSLSWPTPHTTPFCLPPGDPSCPVLLGPNSTPQWKPDPAPARRPRRPQAGTGHGRPERVSSQRGRVATPPPQRDCVEVPSADDTTAKQTTRHIRDFFHFI
jgi:hypothetical protein